MEEEISKISSLRHDLRTKTSSLLYAADFLKNSDLEERDELLALMRQSAREILQCVEEIEEEVLNCTA